MRVLYIDCFSGVSGDMLLGALIDVGVSVDDVRRTLGSLAIDADTVWTERVTRAGLAATKFCVRGEDAPPSRGHQHHDSGHHHHDPGHDHHHDAAHHHHHHDPGHDHHHETGTGPGPDGPDIHGGGRAHGHHAHRSLVEIAALIDRSALSASGKARARAVFDRIGVVEAAMHGTTVDRVHLHEVGALDSIIDIVGTVGAMEALAVDRVVSSPLNVGSGTVRSAHGVYPVPAPATLALLKDAPIYGEPRGAELVTPTGAALVTGYAQGFGPMPPMRVERVGYGAGTRDFRDTPNVTRVVIGQAEAAADDRVLVVEAEVDDMNPQFFGGLIDRLLGDGALDAFFTPIQMKKGRPGTLLTLLTPAEARDRVVARLFRETTTIGVRHHEAAREVLARESVTVSTPAGAVRVKVATRAGARVNAAPEYEDCQRIAEASGRPVKEIHALALGAYYEQYGPTGR